jgi:hypothetical protein
LLFEQLPESALQAESLKEKLPPHLHTLIKNEQDLLLLEEWRKRRK